MQLVEGIEVFIDEAEVLRYQGYQGSIEAVAAPIRDILNQELARGRELAEPKVGYVLLKVQNIAGDSVVLEGGTVLGGAGIAKAWGGAEYLAVGLCTIGPALEEKVSSLFNGDDYAAALMLDSVGTVAVHSAAGYARNVICEKASGMDMQTGAFISPGSRWDISNQRILFELLPAQQLGVRLTENCMMVPQKSLSFCVGIGRQVAGEETAHSCQRCSMLNCRYRKADLVPV